MNQIKQNLLPVGKNGEPGPDFRRGQGRRVRSTCLPERGPVMATLSGYAIPAKTRKGPKRTHSIEFVPYLESLKRLAEVSDETNTCIRRLKTVWKLSLSNRRAKSLLRLLKKDELWVAAYKKLFLNKTAFTAGRDKKRLGSVNIKALCRLKELASTGNYRVGMTHRVNIFPYKRFKGILEFRDRIVQGVLKILLECVYEPRFYESSHGFRPQRSQHTCLRQIKRDFGNTKWVIKGEIRECFDVFNHNIIRKLLSRTIDDKPFINRIIQNLHSKILVPKDTLKQSVNSRTPQGGVNCLLLLLSNILLHQLDRYIYRLKRKIDTGRQQKKDPKHANPILFCSSRNSLGETHKEALGKKTPRTFIGDPYYRRLHYARYANDFVVGVTGPQKLAIRVKMLISRFLKQRLDLQLNQGQIAITQISKSNVSFLGYSIRRNWPLPMRNTQNVENCMRRIRRIYKFRRRIMLFADVNKVIQGLAYKGFCKGFVPVPNFRFVSYSQSSMITRANSMLRGLNEYYKISENKSAAVSRFSYLIRHSIAKMFAAKYKLKSIARVFKKAGKRLENPLKLKGTLNLRADNSKAVKDGELARRSVKGNVSKLLYTKYKHIDRPMNIFGKKVRSSKK